MAAKRPRGGGYYNATLATTGAAIPLPAGAAGFVIHVSAACYIGMANDATLLTFAAGAPNLTNYGVLGAAMWQEFDAFSGGGERFIHVAPVTGTAAVSIAFT